MTACRRLVLLLAIGWAATSGCLAEPFTGSTVVVEFYTDLVQSALVQMPDGSDSHYEMWVNINDEGVISLGRFVVDADLHILSYPDVENRIGSVTGADDVRRSGVRWVTEANLERATSAFVTIEPNGETDVGPSGVVIMEGPLRDDGHTIMRGNMSGEYTTRLGEERNPTAEVAIVLTEDDVYF
jgi:hypothetical protein